MNDYAELYLEYNNQQYNYPYLYSNPNFYGQNGNIDYNRGILLGGAFNAQQEEILIQQTKEESLKTESKDYELSFKLSKWELEEKKLDYIAPVEQNVFKPPDESPGYRQIKKRKAEDSIECYAHPNKFAKVLVGEKRDPLSLLHICENAVLKLIKYCYKYLLEINTEMISARLFYASTAYLLQKYQIDESDIAVQYFRTCKHLKHIFFW